MPVHIQGFPCRMDALCAIAKKYRLKIVEDACQADGGSYHGRRLGTIGDAGALSFNQFKLITCGEGGALLTHDDKLYERALIYHDSNAVMFFGDQLCGIDEPEFCGVEYRTNEISAAILREQLKKMDGIIADLRRIKKKVMEELRGKCRFIPSNDSKGDLATTLAFAFDNPEEAEEFAKTAGGYRPINTNKHIYNHWTPILSKRGAINPLSDPFKMEINQKIIPEYRGDMCPKTLGFLGNTVYISLHPDMSDEAVEGLIARCRKAGGG